MCSGLMSFRAPSAAVKQKNYHNTPSMSPIIPLFQVLLNFDEMTPFDYRFKIIKRVLSLF